MTEEVREKRYRIWYSDGEYYSGWLHTEGSHGRVGGLMEVREQYAKDQIDLEQRARPDIVFAMIEVGASKEEEDKIIQEARTEARQRQRSRWA